MNRYDEMKGQSPSATVTCESAFRELGVNEAFIAKRLKALMEAKCRRWNPEKKSWDEFDDYYTQLAAIRETVKLFGGYPSEGETGDIFLVMDGMAEKRPRSDRGEPSEHGLPDSKASGPVSEVFGNRATSKPCHREAG